MQHSLGQNIGVTRNNTILPVYIIILLIPHVLLYGLISNLEDIKIPFMFLILYTFFISYLFIYYFKAPIYLFYHLIILIAFQNLISGVGMGIFDVQTNGGNIKLLMVYKEIFAIMLVFLLYMRYRKNFKLIKFEKLIPLFVIFLIVHFLISSGTVEAKAYYLRGFAILFVTYILGRLIFYPLKNSQCKMNKALFLVVIIGILAVVIGYIFLIIDRQSSIWKNLFSLGRVMEAKGTAYTDYPDWFTPLGQYYIPRMFSFFFDAINLSYFIMTAIVCSYMINCKGMGFIRFFLFIGLILTFGKGATGILTLIIGWVICLYIFKLRPRLFLTVFISAIIAAFFFLNSGIIYSSMSVHFRGFIEPLLNSPSSPFGHGLGTGGVYLYMLNPRLGVETFLPTGAESFFGTMIYQLGYPGVLFYVSFLVGCIGYLLKLAYIGKKIDFKYILLSGIVFALFTISLFQEATFGINYTGILIVLVGFYISKVQYELKERGLN